MVYPQESYVAIRHNAHLDPLRSWQHVYWIQLNEISPYEMVKTVWLYYIKEEHLLKEYENNTSRKVLRWLQSS